MPAATSSEMQHSFQMAACCAWLLRVGLAATFLSAVADRFGLWGRPGIPECPNLSHRVKKGDKRVRARTNENHEPWRLQLIAFNG
jgi:hypothetical protein